MEAKVHLMRSRLSYSNVVATIALFISLGAGAYAAGIGPNQVKSRHIDDGTIKSRDVKDQGLLGRDIHNETLDFKEIREDRLDVSQFANVVGNGGFCDPSTPAFVDCASVVATVEQTSNLMVIASGGQSSQNGAASGNCQVAIDGAVLVGGSPGEASSDNSEVDATNGFALTGVGKSVRPGSHTVSLQCNQLSGDTLIAGNISVLVLDAT